jgi:hypothetical protein
MTTSQAASTQQAVGRDAFLDVIKAGAMVAVVANHYIYIVIFTDPDGDVDLNMLQMQGNAWVTWPFVWELPAFFLSAAALSVRPATRTPWRTFVGRRSWRLLFPVLPLAGAIALIEVISRRAGNGDCTTWGTQLTCAATLPMSPLWFLAVIVPLTAFTPLFVRWWHGWRRFALPLAVAAYCVVSDIAWISSGNTLPLNDLGVWAIAWFSGMAYADGSLQKIRRRTLLGVIAAGVAGMVALVALGPHPASFAANPRTSMIALECVVGVAVLMLFREQIARTRNWRIIDASIRHVGERVMAVYLWNFVALVIVTGIAMSLGVQLASELSWTYLAQRAAIVPCALIVLAALVHAVAWVERVPYPPDRKRRDLLGRR